MTETAKEVEMEKVMIEIPKVIMDFVRGVEKNPEWYLQQNIIGGFRADIETMDGVWGWEFIFERHNLGPVFEAFGISYSRPPDC